MKGSWAAAFLGTLAGLLVASSVLLVFFLWLHQGLGGAMSPSDVGRLLIWMLTRAGPGALLLGFILATHLRSAHEAGRPRRATLALGCLVGPVLGFVNLGLYLLLSGAEWSANAVQGIGRLFGAFCLAAALAGGAGIGLGCAWWVSRPTRGR